MCILGAIAAKPLLFASLCQLVNSFPRLPGPTPSPFAGSDPFPVCRDRPLPARAATARQGDPVVGEHREKLGKTCLLTPSARPGKMGPQ